METSHLGLGQKYNIKNQCLLLIKREDDACFNLVAISLITKSTILEFRIAKIDQRLFAYLIESDEIFTSKTIPDGIYFN